MFFKGDGWPGSAQKSQGKGGCGSEDLQSLTVCGLISRHKLPSAIRRGGLKLKFKESWGKGGWMGGAKKEKVLCHFFQKKPGLEARKRGTGWEASERFKLCCLVPQTPLKLKLPGLSWPNWVESCRTVKENCLCCCCCLVLFCFVFSLLLLGGVCACNQITNVDI